MSNSDKRDSEGFLSTVILRFDDDDDDDEEDEDEQGYSAAMLIYENKEQ